MARSMRDYVYVDDLVDALLLLGASDASDGRVYNVGSGCGTRMVDVARMIVDIAGTGCLQHAPWPPLAEQIETGDFVADITRVQHELGWSPRVALARRHRTDGGVLSAARRVVSDATPARVCTWRMRSTSAAPRRWC